MNNILKILVPSPTRKVLVPKKKKKEPPLVRPTKEEVEAYNRAMGGIK